MNGRQQGVVGAGKVVRPPEKEHSEHSGEGEGKIWGGVLWYQSVGDRPVALVANVFMQPDCTGHADAKLG